MKIRCATTFDITATGVTGHYKPSRVPFSDRSGQKICNETDWLQARNQQRNWETVTQLISLRTQIDNITDPKLHEDKWVFEFEIESDTIFTRDSDPIGVLKDDCQGVPMLVGAAGTDFLDTDNIKFEVINIS
jgi:hypothetical protein